MPIPISGDRAAAEDGRPLAVNEAAEFCRSSKTGSEAGKIKWRRERGCPAKVDELFEEAAFRFVRLQSRLSDADLQALKNWLNQSQCHRCAWEIICEAWDGVAVAFPKSTIPDDQ